MNKTIVCITSSFPYDYAREETFFLPELEYLKKSFNRVILAPGRIAGNKIPIPDNIIVDENLAKDRKPGYAAAVCRLFKMLFNIRIYIEILKHPMLIVRPSALKRLFAFQNAANRIERWYYKAISRHTLQLNHTVFYTYWLDAYTLGLGSIKDKFSNLKLISRTHGIDLYTERFDPAYQPFQEIILKKLDRLYCISSNGKEYITRKYPWIKSLTETFYLGTADHASRSLPSQDNKFRMVTCGSFIPVKRIDLWIEALALCGNQYHFEWTWDHFGSGPLENTLKDLAKRIIPKNVTLSFHGQTPNSQLLHFYQNTPIDLFVNVSESEGLPVTIMEAASMGIPILATTVGGVPEIVSSENGWLLPANPTPEEIANVLQDIRKHVEQLPQKRANSRKIWQSRFNGSINYASFAKHCTSLI